MAIRKKTSVKDARDGINFKLIILYSIPLSILIFISAILQTTCLSFFGRIPALTLAIVCAIGFILGEKFGAVFGVLSGVLVDMLGSTGLSFSPIIFMLCGYFCGVLVGWFLSKNLPSFIVYSAIAGVLREIFTFVYYGLFSAEFSLWNIFLKIVVPEYLAYIVCIIPAYGAVMGIYLLFKGKDNRGKKNYKL